MPKYVWLGQSGEKSQGTKKCRHKTNTHCVCRLFSVDQGANWNEREIMYILSSEETEVETLIASTSGLVEIATKDNTSRGRCMAVLTVRTRST